jgi:DNA polymerase-3 subunit epsilon
LNFVAIDFETANYERDSACAVGFVKVVDNEIVDKVVHLIRPPTRDFVFTHIHGLTWSDVAESANFGELWPNIELLFEGVEFLVAHNASFDKGVLNACCASYGIPTPSLPFQCSVQIARRTGYWHLCGWGPRGRPLDADARSGPAQGRAPRRPRPPVCRCAWGTRPGHAPGSRRGGAIRHRGQQWSIDGLLIRSALATFRRGWIVASPNFTAERWLLRRTFRWLRERSAQKPSHQIELRDG